MFERVGMMHFWEERSVLIKRSYSILVAGALAIGFAGAAADLAMADDVAVHKKAPNGYEDVWPELKEDVFEDREILDGTDIIDIKTPYRAHDAALVPVTISAVKPQNEKSYIKAITLIIDKNPAPVAAVFSMGPDSGLATLSTRIRVNMYSWVRAVAETNDGKLYEVKNFVKAAGGCSAPAGKDQEEAIASMGKMKLRQFSPAPGTKNSSPLVREAQLMIRHPNHSGFAMDQVTGLFIPAHFVQTIDIKSGEKKILSIEGAISLSEDPSIRFHFVGKENSALSAKVVDTEGKTFTQQWKVKTPPKEGS